MRRGGLFDYAAEFTGTAGTALTISQVPELTWANETLEAYQIQSRADLPASSFTDFSSIQIKTGDQTPPNFVWDVHNDHPETGSSVELPDASADHGVVRIKYQP